METFKWEDTVQAVQDLSILWDKMNFEILI
jgi:hypothetical protein